METDFRAIVREHFESDVRDAFVDVAADILERASLENGNVFRAIDDGLIYDDDKWEVLRQYCNVDDADYSHAEERFAEDISEMLDEIGDDEDEDVDFDVYAYYDGRYAGLESSESFDDAGEASEHVWEKVQKGLFVKVTDNNTGWTWYFKPDETDPDLIESTITCEPQE